jgi:hypothetical protein
MRATLPQAVPSTCAQEGKRVRVMSTSEGAGTGPAENATARADGPAAEPTADSTVDPSTGPTVETTGADEAQAEPTGAVDAPAGSAEAMSGLSVLDRLDGRPLHEHVAVYDELHARLQGALNRIDEA